MREGGGVGHNVPLEVLAFMTAWVQEMNKRETADKWVGDMKDVIADLEEALSKLERILTTPIPWAYSFHIWEVSLHVMSLKSDHLALLLAPSFFSLRHRLGLAHHPWGASKRDRSQG